MSQTTPAGIGRGLTFVMAIAAGLAVANIYYNQPMLGIIMADFSQSNVAGLIPTATQLGYAIGLFLLVPLGDLFDRRKLIVGQFLLLAVVLLIEGAAPNAVILFAVSLLVGAGATVAQQILPFAATLSRPESRGKTIGTVMAGLLCGILLSRTLAGFISTHLGWREMFWISAPVAIMAAILMAVMLPRDKPKTAIGYGEALLSVLQLCRDQAALRRATLTQAALFGSFSAFWTILALHLQSPAYGLGADIAGMFGVLGAVGVLAAPLSGRLADRYGPTRVVVVGVVVSIAAWLVFVGWGALPGLALGVLVFDFGLNFAMISNQHLIFGLVPEARNRINTVYMTGMFLGGSFGSAGANFSWNHGGWPMVCGFGLTLCALALIPSLRQMARYKTA
ncbi:MFS transporter [Thalassospira sp.]|uniref:MFS transporter n=1 Tax=Thalassospira sp. TaxID=1912094 RepID=UPI00273244F7|nr:MFS transporter [Thalassospira sp.]MDP2698099.1 MFS transporter [Thalassospira sp.]